MTPTGSEERGFEDDRKDWKRKFRRRLQSRMDGRKDGQSRCRSQGAQTR